MDNLIIALTLTMMSVISISSASPVNGTSKRCPAGTANEGWIIRKSYSFYDPYDCCDDKVKGWIAVDEYEAPYVETGCSLTFPVQDTFVSRFLYPESCLSDDDCGETSFYGSKMKCCIGDYKEGTTNGDDGDSISPSGDNNYVTYEDIRKKTEDQRKAAASSKGFCAALKHDGSDRCKRAKEVADWVNNGDEDEVTFDTFSGQCYSSGQGNQVCLTCASQCPDGSITGRTSSRMSVTEKFINSISLSRV